jgi:abequosyltransferase
VSTSISICIPVYNCAAYVGQALDSILPQAGDGVEIVIYDGGSTDNTTEVVEPYVKAFPQVRYFRGPVRGGIDADLATCVTHARGEYCWLFSGDDVMRPGGLKRAAETIRSRHDVYVCRHSLCTIAMTFLRDYPVLVPNEALTVELSDPRARREWFSRAANTEAFFSFMGGLLVRRQRWLAGQLIPEFTGSCWAHVARLFELIDSGLSVSFVPEVWLDQRGDNDSFREKGIVDRVRLAIEGFNRIGDHFFSRESSEAFHIRRVLRNEFSFKGFLVLKVKTAGPGLRSDRALLNRLVKDAYVDRSLGNVAKEWAYRLSPLWAIRLAVKLWRVFHPLSTVDLG